MRSVSEVAELAGVTVRTLHHYDRIGLLVPQGRTEAGYRMYDRSDLDRLQQIMFWRTLEFDLRRIADLLDDPQHDRVAALTDQRALLEKRATALRAVVKAVDAALEEAQGGEPVSDRELFDPFDNAEFAAEAERRWGDTDQWAQPQERSRQWTDEDKARLVAEGIAHARLMAEAMSSGVQPDSDQAMDLAEQARTAINSDLYDCDHQMFMALGQMYVEDARFTSYYDQHGEGLAAWFRDAIVANARRNGVSAE